MWTRWTLWTERTNPALTLRVNRARVHSVHNVHSVHALLNESESQLPETQITPIVAEKDADICECLAHNAAAP